MADNADVVRRGYAAFSSGDIDTMRTLFDENAVWHAAGNNRLARNYQGIDQILGYFGQLMEATSGTLRVGTPQVLADGETVVAISENEASGLSTTGVNIFTLKDGKVVDVLTAATDFAGLDGVIGL
jgi:ketosteroid isomerase-like protein